MRKLKNTLSIMLGAGVILALKIPAVGLVVAAPALIFGPFLFFLIRVQRQNKGIMVRSFLMASSGN